MNSWVPSLRPVGRKKQRRECTCQLSDCVSIV